jgi:hypothetical protein
MVAICVAFVAGGILMIQSGEPLGWLALVFFGLGVPVSLAGIWRPTAILLDEERITVRIAIRSWSYEWHEIAEIGIWRQKHYGITVNRLVAFRLRGPQSMVAESMDRVPRSGHVALPSIGVNVQELLDTTTAFWQRALARHQHEDL